jgi:hypothetical protein
MTYEQFVKEELKWEEYRQAHPTCDNCRHFYIDEGMPCCKYYDNVQEDYEHDKCHQWK